MYDAVTFTTSFSMHKLAIFRKLGIVFKCYYDNREDIIIHGD